MDYDKEFKEHVKNANLNNKEQILGLSKPPYFTLCKNPFSNDIINKWESEKSNEVNRAPVTEPFASDISEGKNNPIYNAHSYHTKVPHPAIMRYILHYTSPGDIIFDGFAGTGMTGVAATLCGSPDKNDKYKIESEFEERGQKIEWGKRNCICSDLSPVASFIASNYNTYTDANQFVEESESILNEVETAFGYLYETDHDQNNKGIIKNVIWSDVFSCNSCGGEIVFYESAVDEENGKVKKDFCCPTCGTRTNKKSLLKIWETTFDDLLNETVKQTKKVPVRVVYMFNKKTYRKQLDENDFSLIMNVQVKRNDFCLPLDRMPPGGESRRNDRQGITHVHHFYSKRTLLILNELYKRSTSNAFLLLLNSQLANISKLNRHRPGVSFPYNPLSGTLYIGSQICETNIFKAYRNKVKRLAKAYSLVNENQVVSVNSADDTGIKEDSIDYIFTDPPFGANIMYSELNFISETFLGVKTDFIREAVENKSRNVSLFDYQKIMTSCFQHYFKLLKPGKWMTVEFSNTSASVWNGIQTAIQSAGFIVANVSALDKQQGSFKAVNTVTAVKQDLIISCYKPSSEFDERFNQSHLSEVAVWDFMEEHLKHLPIHLKQGNSTTAIIERSPKILFDRLIAFYVQKGLPVPIDAGKFQQGLRERFVERDGMFFTQEQVQEYDKKKVDNPDFIQLSILVSSEQDGVLWLKNLLAETSMRYQDINPEWMQALAGVRKGDVLPELAVLLEENFLEKEGKWYVPDLENEVDLVKLRTKRLLKQFDEYCTQASKPKGKIKEVRVEALRAGFKHCYQDKDFKTIVQVGDRIPNNLLMEDEVLLQFYDIASSRV